MQILQDIKERGWPFFVLLVLIILFTISFLSYTTVRNTSLLTNTLLERSLQSEVETIVKLFEREHQLRLSLVKNNLSVFSHLFYSKSLEIHSEIVEIEAVNQENSKKTFLKINIWKLDGNKLYGDSILVDKINALVGGTATIFQKTDSGYLRIATNVFNSENKRAVGSYIPMHSPVVKKVESGETYYGRAFVVNNWYTTAYEPILHQGQVVGMLYFGIKEKELPELENIINSIVLGKTGKVYAIDTSGNLVLKQSNVVNNAWNNELLQQMIVQKNGFVRTNPNKYKQTNMLFYRYFEPFNLIIIAEIDSSAEMKETKQTLLKNSLLSAMLSLALLIALILGLAHNRLKRSEIILSEKSYQLAKSEKRFEVLFNNSSDAIYLVDLESNFLEVNTVACQIMGYSREEFLKMNLADIRKGKNKALVMDLMGEISEKGELIYEVQHQKKNGELIHVEMKSRLIDYEGESAILFVARNIDERKAMQKKIISTVIQTEEKERKRFAADLHDELGPVLSTIKLYNGLLKSKHFTDEKTRELVKDIDELTDMAISTTRDLQNRITPTILHDFGLAMAIEEFCKYINKTKSVKISSHTNEYLPANDDIVETILFQVVKELINNTIKHSGSQNIKIDLKTLNQQILLYYKDDGVGFDFEQMIKDGHGLGLNNIMHKVKTIKGMCDFYSRPEQGMFVLITIKLKE